jgi:dihydroneopterin aldolase
MDEIEIRRLLVPTHVGVTEDERAEAQPIVATITMTADIERAAASDDLADTVDYGEVVADVAQVMSTGTFALLEHLAGSIASSIARFAGVRGVTVEVVKPSPPVPQDVKEVAVRIHRSLR